MCTSKNKIVRIYYIALMVRYACYYLSLDILIIKNAYTHEYRQFVLKDIKYSQYIDLTWILALMYCLCLRIQAPKALCFRVARLYVHPKPEIPSFHLYMGPLVYPTNCERFAACPSVRGSFRAFAGERMEGNGLKLCRLMYLGHLQKWLDYGHGLLIFLLLAPLWFSETGQIWGCRVFPEHM